MSTTTTQTQVLQPFAVSNDIEIPRGPVQSSLVFYAPPADGAAPFNYVEQQPEGQPQRNYGENPHQVTINDVRGREKDFSIDTTGFEVIQGVDSKVEDFADEDQIKKNYYAEVEQLLLENVPGAKKIFIFDHTVRRSTPNAHRAPVNRAHIDQTTKSAIQRVEYHLPDEAEELLKGRYRLINVWRPLNGAVVSNPLAYADSRSVPDSDIVPVEHRYPHRTGETAGVQYTEQGRWYYLSGMTNDERILLQCFDNGGSHARTPHSAFVDPRTKPGWKGRESIEVRALVFG